jgi:hypothetical protein
VNLVVKGTIDGKLRGWLYLPGSETYQPDTTNLAAMSRGQLRAKVLAGDTLTIMGVPAGAGTRIGIARNLNGVLDGDEPVPALRIARAGPGSLVSWPTNATGFLLEHTAQLPATHWSAETNVRGVNGAEFTITNSFSMPNRFYRLRGL